MVVLRLHDHKIVSVREKETQLPDCESESARSPNGHRKNAPNSQKSVIEIESFHPSERGPLLHSGICVEEPSLRWWQGRFGRSGYRALLEKRVPLLLRKICLPPLVDKIHECNTHEIIATFCNIVLLRLLRSCFQSLSRLASTCFGARFSSDSESSPLANLLNV